MAFLNNVRLVVTRETYLSFSLFCLKDEQAIAALKKCLKLDAENLEALKELAVCYTNENYQYQACYTLKVNIFVAYSSRGFPTTFPIICACMYS